MDIEEVAEALKISGRHVSMDAPFAQGEENRLLDIMESEELPAPDHFLMTESLKAEIDRILSTLSVIAMHSYHTAYKWIASKEEKIQLMVCSIKTILQLCRGNLQMNQDHIL